LTIEGFIGLFAAMTIVAVIPGPAVFAISSASMSGGFSRGLNMTIGLLLADVVFILVVVSGLAFVAETLSPFFTILKYCCAAYLIWMGVSLFLSSNNQSVGRNKPINARSDMLAGFLLTISNPKAIVFYVALFPAFINFNGLSKIDVIVAIGCAILAFGSVNLGYAFIASRAYHIANNSSGFGWFRKLAGTLLTLTGVVVAARA
jgi:threonine/homoserine/homoserine lactone efflux protein